MQRPRYTSRPDHEVLPKFVLWVGPALVAVLLTALAFTRSPPQRDAIAKIPYLVCQQQAGGSILQKLILAGGRVPAPIPGQLGTPDGAGLSGSILGPVAHPKSELPVIHVNPTASENITYDQTNGFFGGTGERGHFNPIHPTADYHSH